MTKQAKVFISYAHENIDREALEYLVARLKEESKNNIEFLFDSDVSEGSDFEKFMDLLDHVDGVIIILTPSYKKRVDVSREGAVYKEYCKIIRRYEELEEKANNITTSISQTDSINSFYELIKPPFPIFPVLFSTDHSAACPDRIKSIRAYDFSTFRVSKDKNGILFETKQNKIRHDKLIQNIAKEIIVYASSNSPRAQKTFDEIFAEFFNETKQERVKNKNTFQEYFLDIFVKTHAYKKVRDQSGYILIGRKGSGKTTTAHYLSLNQKNIYKKHIEIDVNKIKLDYAYSLLSSKQVRGEQDILKDISIFEISWFLFIYISCMNVVLNEYKNNKTSPEQNKFMKTIEDFVTSITGRSKLDYGGLFSWCCTAILEYKEKAIKSSSDDMKSFSYEMGKEFTREIIVKEILTHAVFNDFENVLKLCKRKFFVSLDGFDTTFQEFRKNTLYIEQDENMKKRRSEFEIDWLRALAHIIMDIKTSKNSCNSLLSNLGDFCIMIPKDRFLEIRNLERDSIEYDGKYHDIMWSAIELSIMLRKRLEVLSNSYVTNKQKGPEDRLEEILLKEFSYIPTDSIVSVSSVDYKMPIFIDVLRHTFWRPREVLIYFAKIISVSRELKKRDIEVTNFEIDKCISGTTRGIIKGEFFNEFRDHCVNLVEIVNLFRKKKQILEYDEMSKIIGPISFDFTDKRLHNMDFKTKLEFLYEIGFLGLEANEKVLKKHKLLNQDFFWFTAKDEPFDAVSLDDFEGCRFIIHPIFCEYLNLDTTNQRLTLNIDWDYLRSQEAHVVVPS